MKFGRYGIPYVILRIGLGVTFLLIGIDILRNPQNWIGYVPGGVPLGLSREGLLAATGVFDAIVGLGLILRVMPKVSSGLAALHLIGIIITSGIDPVIVRDIGLLAAALALFFWPTRHHRKHQRWRVGSWINRGGGGEAE